MNPARTTDPTRWHRQSRALDELLDREEHERAHALQQIAASDPELATELAELLTAEASTGLFERGLGDLAQHALDDSAHDHPLTKESDHIGPWCILRRIGQGGMGEVFLVERQQGGFRQHAALKRLKRGMDSEEILTRFLQERQILASLGHANIARLLDGGLDASDRPYFVMEYVEGAPITQWTAAHGSTLRERVTLMRKVCAAVAYAQSRLVVHRDLKPSNILVDTLGEPHLLDFGIAKWLDDHPDLHQTRTGLRVLSPTYAAPEQLQGNAISTATDVYALGVVLYELLTGQLPYRRTPATSTDAIIGNEYGSLLRPSQRLRQLERPHIVASWGQAAIEPTRLARLLAGDLDRIVMMALRPEPERRYASAAALAADLQAFLDGRPISARPDSSGYRLRKFVQRHRWGVAATVLALIVLMAGFGTALWQAGIAREQAAEADHQRKLAQAQARRAQETRDFVVTLLTLGSPDRSREGMQTTAVDLIRDAASRVDALTDAADTQAELQVAIGNGLISLGAAEEGLARLETGIAQLRTLGEDAWPVLADALHYRAMHDTATGRLDQARAASEESLALYDRLDRDDLALNRITTLTTLAKNVLFRGDLAASQQLYERILAERRQLLGPDDPRLAVDWNNLGSIAARRDRYAEAEHAYAQASHLLALDPQAPESRQSWLHLGRASALIGLGRFDEAEAAGLRALEIAERTLHDDHVIGGSIRIALARLYRYMHRLDEAVAMAERARDIYAAASATQLGSVEMQLGMIYLAQDRNVAALTILTDANHHFASQSNREEADYFLATAALAFARLRNGDVDALAALDAALEELGQRYPEPSNALAETLALRATAAALLGHDDLDHWRAVETQTYLTLFGPEHPRSIATRK